MLNIPIRPVSLWPGTQNQNPKSSPFRAGYKQTLKELDFELDKAGTVDGSWFVEMFVGPEDIRNDGNLRASARVTRPGVIFRFSRFTGKRLPDGRKETQDVSYPCDAFDSWQDNLRAIALSMRNLRHVERYGVFKYGDIISRLALPTAEGKVSTRDTAAAFIAEHSGINRKDIESDNDARATAYKIAARRLHPDNAATGDKELFLKLNEANVVLTTGY